MGKELELIDKKITDALVEIEDLNKRVAVLKGLKKEFEKELLKE